MREFLAVCLGRAGHQVTTAKSGADALRILNDDEDNLGYDIVITDLTMPGIPGMEVLRHARERDTPPQVIMITAYATTDTAVEAMKLGAYDYLIKPFKVDEILVVVQRALERRALRSENRRLRDALDGVHTLDRMIGRSEAMQKVFDLVRRVAPTRTNVLIRGESGTGKELVARALHKLSDRAEGPFVPVNCGAIPEQLMESELFGHVKGAFTGAAADRRGVFEIAEGGTLFLDEIGELDVTMQVKLLRVLQERSIRPVGGSKELSVDCRVVAATNRDLEAAVESGEFRSDLYFRLDVVRVVLPPLRHRSEDIPLLAARFFDRFNREMKRNLDAIGPEALDWLLTYDYPGNVRELENLIERAVALESTSMLSAAHFPDRRPQTRTNDVVPERFPPEGLDLDAALADLERSLILAALDQAGGVRKRAAELLNISFRSMRYRLKKLGIEVGRGDDD
ncbi:sigma-54-dependent Fis family transcriptional regulator [Pseudenhygromyxa sp. WMMC2535]|nr:sigma-54 dependent transcriptional regulator [Pseudenhygromyxa sp. WMMC2535]NVB42251.1 sigma-54-dependent Fis family transcriptional regulator [Pseudenhygromyxa sp. WMMC2535]